MFGLVEIEPVSEEVNQLNDSSLGTRSVARPGSGFVSGVSAKDFNFQTIETQKTKRERKIESQSIVLDLRRQSSKLPDRIEIKGRRIDAVSAQRLRLLLPARKQFRILQPGSNNRMDTTRAHHFPTIS